MSGRRVLVVGGTGMIGAHIATLLAERGDRVTVSSRAEPRPTSPVRGMPHLPGDYTAGTFTTRELEPFEAIVFSAGTDTRHVAPEDESDEYWARAQSEAVPAFAALARDAGVGRFVQVGSCYHQVMPALAQTHPYVRARQLADERTRALATDGFAAMTVNPPPIVGSIPGPVLRRFERMVDWVRGATDSPPLTAPPGATNYLSARSLAQAVAGALDRGASGTAYLVGDENLSYREFFQLFADESGSGATIEERDEEHPFLMDRYITQGRGQVLAYEPDAAETALLGYDRRDVRRAVREIVDEVDRARG